MVKNLPAVRERRRRWHPAPVLLPGKSRRLRSLVGCSPWGRWESDTTERLNLLLFTFIHWRRKWQPAPVFLPGESQGQGSLVGCRLWSHTESDTTEVTSAAAAVRETWVWYLGGEDALEEGMATYSSILAWRIPMDRRDWWATVHGVTKIPSMGSQRIKCDWMTKYSTAQIEISLWKVAHAWRRLKSECGFVQNIINDACKPIVEAKDRW